jgi:deoxyribonuclease-4
MSQPRLGAHMSIAGGLASAIDRAEATGCEALQIFTKSSNQWRARPLSDLEVQTFRDRAAETSIKPIVAHASYLINIASPTQALWKQSVAALDEEMRRAELLGLAGVILHPGAYTTSTEKDGLLRIADGIADVIERKPDKKTQLLLEHTAGQGTVLGYQFEQLRKIIDYLHGAPRIGICLDTCHLVAAGYDIISPEGQSRVFDDFGSIIGFDRLKTLHLNDSKKPLGSRVDRHEHIGKGCIGIEPFRQILQDNRLKELPMILETPKTSARSSSVIEADPMDLENLNLLRTLRKK